MILARFVALTLTLTFTMGAALVPSSPVLAAPSISPVRLAHEIQIRATKVDEFNFIREQAQKLGIRAWLFGGTAAAYGHYVNWDLAREHGDTRFQKERFDYDYTNIYRSTQDLDLVVDGTPEQAAALESALKVRFPHLQGSKSVWEVRLLRKSAQGKDALLDNPDYLNQHTDSNSTGMIELTPPRAGEAVVRDLRDWRNPEPAFLKDLHEGKLHYYFSDRHFSTARAREGLNPEIFSAVRFLTKAFQYHLEIRDEDLAKIREIIRKFDPRSDFKTQYARDWIERNASKLIQHAVDIEYAWDTLEKLGLRKKLISIRNDPNTQGSLAWWMSRVPLRSKALGQGKLPTARARFGPGEIVLAHETIDYLAYESINRAHTGEPNVLISRKQAIGEHAVHGDGFYTQVGRRGARDTGLTIRFVLDPDAREGTDFEVANGGNYVIVLNKSAIRVIPEALSPGIVDYFRRLVDGKTFDHSDRGIWERLRRRIAAKRQAPLTEEQESLITEMILKYCATSTQPSEEVLGEWFSLSVSRRPEVFARMSIPEALARKVAEKYLKPQFPDARDLTKLLILNPSFQSYVLENAFANRPLAPLSTEEHSYLEKLLQRQELLDPFARHILTQPFATHYPEWFQAVWKQSPHSLEKFVKKVFSVGNFSREPTGTHWIEHRPELIAELIREATSATPPSGAALHAICEQILANPASARHPEWALTMLKISTPITLPTRYRRGGIWIPDRTIPLSRYFATEGLRHPHWAQHPDLLRHAIQERLAPPEELVERVFATSAWSRSAPDQLSGLLSAAPSPEMAQALIEKVLTKTEAIEHPEWLERILTTQDLDAPFLPKWYGHGVTQRQKLFERTFLSQPQWLSRHPDLVTRALGDCPFPVVASAAAWAIKHPESGHSPAWFRALLRAAARGQVTPSMGRLPLRFSWRDPIMERDRAHVPAFSWLAAYLLADPVYGQQHPELVLEFLAANPPPEALATFAQRVLTQPFASQHPEWVDLLFAKADLGRIEIVAETRYEAPRYLNTRDWVRKHVLSRPEWHHHPEAPRIPVAISRIKTCVENGLRSLFGGNP